MTPEEAFLAYEAVRADLPPAATGGAAEAVATLDDLAERFDVFLLDAFGVLNVGQSPIPGVAERIAGLRARGKRCLVLTNAGGHPHAVLMARYERLGFSFDPDDVITSRKALLAGFGGEARRHWGLAATPRFGTEDFDEISARFLGDDPEDYAAAEGFLFLGSAEWTEARQALLEAAVAERPRPVLVSNPDIVAPREDGMSLEPGYFAHRLRERTGVAPEFFGKPFTNIYDIAFERLGPMDRSRVVMVGDSLHTDILGAHAAGVASALITGYGFFADLDARRAIEVSGVWPDFVMPRP